MLQIFEWRNIGGVDLGGIFTWFYTALDKAISNRRNLTATALKKDCGFSVVRGTLSISYAVLSDSLSTYNQYEPCTFVMIAYA